MTSSIFLYSNPIVTFGLAVMMTTFSQTISVNSSANCKEQMRGCREHVLLTCTNITKMTNTSYWYRLSPEKMMTMLENSCDLSGYEVSKTYETTETWLKFLSPYDTGLYSCLDRSKPRGEQVICCIKLNVGCNGIENNYHTKQHLQKIENGEASPYTFRKTITFISRQTDEPIVVRSYTRGYPKPNYSTFKTNHDDFSGKDLKMYDGESYLFLPEDKLEIPTSYTIRTCNTNGCIDNILHSLHKSGNNTVVIGEVKGAYVTFCCDAELNSSWNVQWFVKNENGKINTEKRRTSLNAMPCLFIFDVSNMDAGTYQCSREQNSTWETIATFELKIFNDSISGKFAINQATISAENVPIKDSSFGNDGSITNMIIIILITALSVTIIFSTNFFRKYRKEMKEKDIELAKMTELVEQIIIPKQIYIDSD
ncbi:uncharacterized protein LOC135843928 [Planococcus citri]|uniref:uncharacterized protein LOC135843928 n=1 Tax=Planococcus citri TaxID=170843 RepID=UPI0031F77F29